MANLEDQRRRHFILKGTAQTEQFRSPQGGGGTSAVPGRNRNRHGGALLRQIEALRPQAAAVRDLQEKAGLEEGLGLQVEFESFPGIDLALESLAREGAGIELQNVRHEGKRVLATVFIPDGKLDVFENLHSTQ